MVEVIEQILTIEQADSLTEKEILKLENEGCRLVYLVNQVLLVRYSIYQPKFKKKRG